MNRLAIVVPCYNEEEVINETATRFKALLKRLIEAKKILDSSYVLFVNDGSNDTTWDIISELHNLDKTFNGINLAKNVGHQNALVAGLNFVSDSCDIAISIDADLQDDINAIEEMVDAYDEGYDIVYGVRSSRKKDSFFKKHTALLFYKIMLFLGVNTIYNHADYRLMSKRAIKQFMLYGEKNMFIRGVVPLIGYKTKKVYYKRESRFAGESKYPLRKMINFAVDGITSFSVKPIRFIFIIGFICLIFSFASLIYILISYNQGNTVPGWTSVMISLWFLGSITILSLGIIGEYIGKIYSEVKRRPSYNIETVLFD
ncbi:MAG: glycosyltransferase family 2 protein [Bacteroidales bacterium]|nr:glycosyltransferase family 2 protein [Bacteroidales bacterium]MDD4218134.1 glycosyltransferase family 2 protein [Bacteroidales bacterium]MDY0142865.1 glycosyltransferase family 2 protein [Bacteroidales bacterium]